VSLSLVNTQLYSPKNMVAGKKDNSVQISA